MSEVYWECPMGFRWAWKDKDASLADRLEAHDVLFSFQEQMAKTGEKYALQVDSDGIAVSVKTLTHMTGLLDWATTFNGSQQVQQPDLIVSKGPFRDDNLLTAAESFFQTNAYKPFATCIRVHTGSVPVSWKEAAPEVGKDSGAHRSIAHFCPHTDCNGQDSQHFRSNKNTVRDIKFLEEASIFS